MMRTEIKVPRRYCQHAGKENQQWLRKIDWLSGHFDKMKSSVCCGLILNQLSHRLGRVDQIRGTS